MKNRESRRLGACSSVVAVVPTVGATVVLVRVDGRPLRARTMKRVADFPTFRRAVRRSPDQPVQARLLLPIPLCA